MKTILITGGAGFIGSNFVRYIYNKYKDYKIIVLDLLTYAGSIDNLPININETKDERIEFWYGNVKNPEIVNNLVSKCDSIVHFAAETHVTRSIFDNYVFFETDVLGTQCISNSVLKQEGKIERFIHISTSEVYGTARSELMDENHPLMPSSPYASAKTGADRLVYSYFETYDIPAIIVRPFNNYGPYQHLEKVIPRFITSCILNEPLKIHGDGSFSRDFVYVEDTCKAIDIILHADIEKIKGEVFNVATGEDHSVLSIAKDILVRMGKDESLIQYVENRPGQVKRHTGDAKKIEKICGWKPSVSWEKGLETTIDWYINNKPWWGKQIWMRSVPIVTKSGKRTTH